MTKQKAKARKRRAPVAQVFKGSDGMWRSHVRGRNGRILACSARGFYSSQQARNNLNTVIGKIRAGVALSPYIDVAGEHRWTLTERGRVLYKVSEGLSRAERLKTNILAFTEAMTADDLVIERLDG